MKKLIFLVIVLTLNCISEERMPKYQKESKEYIEKVKIINLKGEKSSLTGSAWIEGEIKNTGNKVIETYVINFYFLNKNGEPIYEKSKKFSYQNIKPNYIDKFFLEDYSVPEEWYKKKKLKAEITFVKVEEEKETK